jgi:transcriptional antiterminator RfaH
MSLETTSPSTDPVTASSAWYVIHTKPRNETRALENLQNQGFECFLPTMEVEKRVRQRVQTLVVPMFSRYLFIRLNDVNQNWAPIRSTLGVSKLVSFGNQPAKAPQSLIDFLRQAPAAEIARLFGVGDTVQITDGPLKGLQGTYQEHLQDHDGDQCAMVLVDLLGQPQKLRMTLDSLHKIES